MTGGGAHVVNTCSGIATSIDFVYLVLLSSIYMVAGDMLIGATMLMGPLFAGPWVLPAVFRVPPRAWAVSFICIPNHHDNEQTDFPASIFARCGPEDLWS